jgi:hypothetical protein
MADGDNKHSKTANAVLEIRVKLHPTVFEQRRSWLCPRTGVYAMSAFFFAKKSCPKKVTPKKAAEIFVNH